MIAFFLTMPIRRMMPITAMMPRSLRVSISARSAPTPAEGSVERIVSYIHPLTILPTLPSAGVGALLALMLTRTDLGIIAVIGMLVLSDIVEEHTRSEGRRVHAA